MKQDDREERTKARGGDGTRRRELCLLVIVGGAVRSYPIAPGVSLTIGRDRASDVFIDDPAVSRRHAVLQAGAQLTLTDLGSVNGTTVRTQRGALAGATERVQRLVAERPVRIEPGDFMDFGAALALVWQASDDASRHATMHDTSTVAAVQFGAMQKLQELLARVAAGNISVLLLGETGVGKEVHAERVHRLSPRASKPFVAVNCAALAETLLESELFGHEKGAFTGAHAAKLGLIESADGGTLFLDEIGELPPSVQVKLLRVLEERAVRRVGSLQSRPVDVRIVSATHRDLLEACEQGTFRKDLYFRLDGISLYIPPLRERVDEIEGLAKHFVANACERLGRPAPRLGDDALALLEREPWPGNIRQLRNVVERAALLCTGDEITAEHLMLAPARASRPPESPPPVAVPPIPPLRVPATRSAPPATLDEVKRRAAEQERQITLDALEQCGGNQSRAAELLGISRRTLIYRIEAYGLPRPRKR